MAKKQPLKSSTQNVRQPNVAPSKKSTNNTPSFSVSNKILIPAVLLFFVALAFVYCMPLLQGMQYSTHDSNQYVAMNKEIADYKAATGETALWSSRMFGGMPAYVIGGIGFSRILEYTPVMWLHKTLRLIPDPAMDIVFLLFATFLGLYILTRKVSYSTIGALAVGLCTANFVSLAAGHITKVITIAMFLPLFSGAWLIFRKKYLFGAIVFLFFLYEIIAGAHIQIAYYSLILIGIYMLYEFVNIILEKDFKHAGISGLILGVGFAIGIMMNFQNFFVNDFSKETTRGGDILNTAVMNPGEAKQVAKSVDNKEKGVGFDYATQWSLGYEELGSLIVPNYTGAINITSLDTLPNFVNAIQSNQANIGAAMQSNSFTLYWGSEPFVQGPIYLGIIVFFLFVFGMFAYKGKLKWWILGSIIFATLMAFGKNFASFYHLLYNVVPMFNKFRAPTMVMALVQVLMVIIGILGLKDFLDSNTTKEDRIKTLKFSGAITGVLVLSILLFGGFASFKSKNVEGGISKDDVFREEVAKANNPTVANAVMQGLIKDRQTFSRNDAIRAFILVLIAVAVLFVFALDKLPNANIVLVVLTLLIVYDFWAVNKRYLNNSSFSDKSSIETNAFPETPADATILAENKDGSRMFDFTTIQSRWNSASSAYYHRTIDGYSPAKLQRYQDIISYGLEYDLMNFVAKGQLEKANFWNMLNTKYIKQSEQANGVSLNPYALGNAWFVANTQIANTNEEEILKVRDINPKQTAIVHKEFESYLKDITPNTDSAQQTQARFIEKVDTKNPMKLEYNFKSNKDELVVFSEVIYRPNSDWLSYIDGKPADHIRVNYILRGMKVKAGEHKITFEFKPKMYALTNTVLLAGNFLFYVLIGGLLFWFFKKHKQEESVLETV
ncbi:MAG: hypothetical protein U0U67_02665 [Chitinophagales bacterium]